MKNKSFIIFVTMERETEVNHVLGEGNVKLFLAEVRNGLITEDDLKQIALKMDGRVHGTYVEKVRFLRRKVLEHIGR